MANLTRYEVNTLERVRAVIKVNTVRLLAEYPECKPTSWALVDTLIVVHGLKGNHLDSLVKKGYLLRRSTDGFGPEVKPTIGR